MHWTDKKILKNETKNKEKILVFVRKLWFKGNKKMKNKFVNKDEKWNKLNFFRL